LRYRAEAFADGLADLRLRREGEQRCQPGNAPDGVFDEGGEPHARGHRRAGDRALRPAQKYAAGRTGAAISSSTRAAITIG